MFRIAFHQPEIPPNTGNAIRLAACTGSELHLIEPLGFVLQDKQLRRAGLDYHDLASVVVHSSWPAAVAAWSGARVFAFTTGGGSAYDRIAYRAGDVLLFGAEADGLPPDVLGSAAVTARVRLPMLPGRRSLNLSNCAAIAVYEAWRQHGFRGVDDPGASDDPNAPEDPGRPDGAGGPNGGLA